MRNAIWIGRRQVKGLIILLALLPLIPTALLIHTLWQNSAEDENLAIDDMNRVYGHQLNLAVERFLESGKVDPGGNGEELVSYLTYVLGPSLPMQIRTSEGELVYRTENPTGDTAFDHLIGALPYNGWTIRIDAISELPTHLGAQRRVTLTQTSCALLGTLLIAGGVWFAINRSLSIDDIRKDLISTISHEIKTPVAAIKVLTESLEEGELPPDSQKEYLQLVAGENERIEGLADRFLTFGRLERGQFPVDQKATSLDAVIGEVAQSLNPRFHSAGGKLIVKGESKLSVYADANGLEIILSNLLENGLKYGGVPPHVLLHARSDSDRVIVTVTDNGTGIEPAERRAVFRRFYRSEGRLSDGQKGVGLGLAICRRIVRLMKSSLSVQDSTHSGYSGAEFKLVLPSCGRTTVAG